MLRPKDFRQLSEQPGPCLTLFEPLIDGPRHLSPAASRIQSAVHRASELLDERGFSESFREGFLAPIQAFSDDPALLHPSGSVVLFRSSETFMADFVPEVLTPTLRLGPEFYILPLLTGALERTEFWLLAIALKRVKLFRGNAVEFHEVDAGPAMPQDLFAAGGFDVPDRKLEARSQPGGGSGRMPAIRFSTNSAREVRTSHIRDFFRQIDHAIHPLIARTEDPLILAGISRELALYRTINTSPNLVGEAIAGSPHHILPSVLHQQALGALRRHHAMRESGAAKRAEATEHGGARLRDIGEAESAASAGQIARLIVDAGRVKQSERVNRLILTVIRMSGEIVCASGSDMPDGVAAQLRYAWDMRVAERSEQKA